MAGKLAALLLLCSLPLSALARDICVDGQNLTGIEDGTPLRPFRSLQAGIDSADLAGDTVKVANGNYAVNVRIIGKSVAVVGGYAGGTPESYVSAIPGDFASRDASQRLTHLIGVGLEPAILLQNSGQRPAQPTVIDGFRISGGRGRRDVDPPRCRGGGIFCAGGFVRISNNLFEHNDARAAETPAESSLGGGIYIDSADFEVSGNVLRGNQAGRGGGIAIAGARGGALNNTLLEANFSELEGGGLYLVAAFTTVSQLEASENRAGVPDSEGQGGAVHIAGLMSCTLTDLRLHHNWAAAHGGALSFDASVRIGGPLEFPLVRHALIYRNETGACGGGAGVYVGPLGDFFAKLPAMEQCTFANNGCGPPEPGAAIYTEFSGLTLRNIIAWDNGGQDVRGPVQGTGIHVEGGGAPNPRFANSSIDDYHLQSRAGRWDPGANDWVVDDFHSPCIDAGGGPSGQDEPLPNGARLNLGADGGTLEASLSTLPAPHDCDNNGLDDGFEIDEDPSLDCDRNHVLDACEALFDDCNENHIGDGCEPDADGDGVIDDCDSTPNGENQNANGNGNRNSNANDNSANSNLNQNSQNDNTGRPQPNGNSANANANSNTNDNSPDMNAAVCPTTAAVLLSLTLIGRRRGRSRRAARFF